MDHEEDDVKLFMRHETLLAEEESVSDALRLQREDAKRAMRSKESLVLHRATGDVLWRRLREVECELETVERVIALRFREGWNKIIFASTKDE